jgi:hypothetical protein
MNKRETVDLAADRLRVEELWRTNQSTYVPLRLGASFTMHAVGSTGPSHEAVVTPHDYANALNIAAAALSAVIPIHAQLDGTQSWVAVAVDPVRDRFEGGATVLRGRDGKAVLNLLVKRAAVVSAIPIIERVGVTFYVGLPAKNEGPIR